MHLFEEMTPGVYDSDPFCFVGIPGDTYQLKVTRTNGVTYMSDPVVLKKTPPIDSIHYERDRRITPSDTVLQDGIKILVGSHDPESATRYYRYEWTETYEIKVPYPEDIAVSVCYNTRTNTSILTATSQSLREDRISQFELKYVTTESYELRNMYSIVVRQYALDEQAFAYWSQLQKLSETLGSLFDPQPYSVTGNMRNPDDKDEIVLGYFDASTISEKRIFVSRADLSELTYPDQGCYWNLVTVRSPAVAPIGYCLATQGLFGSGENIYAPPKCCNCTLYGTLQKPTFWPR